MNLDRFAKLFDLSGRVAFVTGANRGLGMTISNALYDAGATVVTTDIQLDEDSSLYPEITDRGILDVTDEEAVKAYLAKTYERYGRIDILINNAGIIYKDIIDELDIERYKHVIDVNLNGTVICTKYVIPYMKEHHWGRIVNISSSQAFLALETYTPYAASKAATAHLSRVWGNEMAKENILINGLCPCYADTPMLVDSATRMAQQLGTDFAGGVKYFEDKLPLGRILKMEEVGNWAVALCSGLGDATTGSNFAITCGQVQL